MALSVKEILSSTGTQFTADGTFTFPSGVTKVRAFLWGGGGKNGTQVGGGQGGAGAYVAVDIPKGSRTALTIYLNKGGGSAGPISAGGFGGGYSAVYTATDGYIAIAGGGGGSGGGYWGGGGGFYNGSQGGNNSQPGSVSTANNYSHGGGGSQSAGGSAGVSPFNAGFINGSPGSSLTGGGAGGSGYGGGGGGGYYGGGGGGGDANVSPYTGMGAGGGGSSYISAVASLVQGQAGPNGASGGVNPGGLTSGYYLAPYGASNQNGLVVIVPFLPIQQVPPQIKMSNIVPTVKIQTFLGTGSIQTFTVPQGVTAIRFFMWGAGGNNQNQNGTIVNGSGGGSGAYLEGAFATTPGSVLYIIVGQNGVSTLAGGGAGIGTYGGSGGGFTGIFSGSPAANNVIAIAGGGGGCCANGRGSGGGGGYPNGGGGGGSTGGGGGTQTSGGSAGGNGFPGTQLQGGNAGNVNDGGGGGGWYGGGGAGNYNGGGGGGSSTYISSVINPVSINGSVGITTTGSNTPAPNESSLYWISPYGRSAANGLLVLAYSFALPLLQWKRVWQPTQVSNLQLWLDASNPVPANGRNTIVMSGANVSQWSDKTTNAYNFSSSGTISLGAASGLNNRSVAFTGGNSMSSGSVSLTYNQSTVFVVCRVTANGGENFSYILSQGAADFALRLSNGAFNNPGNTNDWGNDPATNTNSTIVNGTAITVSSPNIIGTTAIISSTVGKSFTGLQINGTFNNRVFTGFMFEVLLYSSVPTTAQRQQVEGYLAWKWDLVGNLPANHPYKNSPP